VDIDYHYCLTLATIQTIKSYAEKMIFSNMYVHNCYLLAGAHYNMVHVKSVLITVFSVNVMFSKNLISMLNEHLLL